MALDPMSRLMLAATAVPQVHAKWSGASGSSVKPGSST